MKRPPKRRYQLYLDADLADWLESLAVQPGASRSAILVDALQAWRKRRAAHELDDRFGLRLDRNDALFGRIERDQQIVMESLALFIRYFLTINAPIPEGDQAARAVGRDRFKAFIDRVGRNLASGTRTLGRAGPVANRDGDDR